MFKKVCQTRSKNITEVKNGSLINESKNREQNYWTGRL